ncbi:hypothetical protein BuS5_03688 [Desulfosarcina sp. BuS5]|uniref:PilN domain-containing protein n=1 Tax=Desulfosarcina sp. BuS5 TaxID=933262 RepID=UPI000482D1CA|nr:PilN domain-containing protein [Desulfosarcina sp. BuS5]WDN90717.1 hypothetical protein BuS5_03688 [Desulfosarcina sp. BuS5]
MLKRLINRKKNNAAPPRFRLLNLFGPSATGCAYHHDNPVQVEGSLDRKKFSWKLSGEGSGPAVLAVSMENFIFRMVDISPDNPKVIAGQINRFLPFAAPDLTWLIIPVAGKSFIIALTRARWREIISGFVKGRKKPPFVIPSIVAAAIYHLWMHNGNGDLAVPVDSGYLLMCMRNGCAEKIEQYATIPDREVVIYDNPELIACGAAIYALIPHNFKTDLGGRRPFARFAIRPLLYAACCAFMTFFFIYSLYSKDLLTLEKLNNSISDIRQKTGSIEAVINRNKNIETTADFLHKFNDEYISPYLVMGDVAVNLPEKTFLTDFFIDAGKGYITGVSRDVTTLLELLSGRAYVSRAEFTTPVVRDAKGNERFQIGFEIEKDE